MTEARVSSIDLQAGVVALMDGQRVPITKYLGAADQAPADGEHVAGFAWVSSVVAGPDADGNWLAVSVSDGDRKQ